MIPHFSHEKNYYRHHVHGGTQSTEITVTWLGRTFKFEYTRSWKKEMS